MQAARHGAYRTGTWSSVWLELRVTFDSTLTGCLSGLFSLSQQHRHLIWPWSGPYLDEMAESDCPLCCEPFTNADKRYPLNCRTETCQFDFCRTCIQKLYDASLQGYSEASDGSKQVKIYLQCPQCRAPYEYRDSTTGECIVRSADVVQSVLDLRRSAATPLPNEIPDHELSSSVLAARTLFTQETGFAQLRLALKLLQQYYDSFPTNPVGKLPTEDVNGWEPFLQAEKTKVQVAATLDRDPTLFYGLDQFLTTDEQEYITRLLVSNNPKFLEQAAHLLHSVMTCGKPPLHESTADFVEKCHSIRKSYPLPRTMPRCLALPYFNPLEESRKLNPLHFEPNTLIIRRATGAAAKLGLRRGDMVTHIAGERVERWDAYVVCVQQLQPNDVTLTVNADVATAQALHDRSCRMRSDNVTFL